MNTNELSLQTKEELTKLGLDWKNLSEETQMNILSKKLTGEISASAFKEYITTVGTTVNTFLNLLETTSNNIKHTHADYCIALNKIVQEAREAMAINPDSCTSEMLNRYFDFIDKIREDIKDSEDKTHKSQDQVTECGGATVKQLIWAGTAILLLFGGIAIGRNSGNKR